jgi:hypothetical protein
VEQVLDLRRQVGDAPAQFVLHDGQVVHTYGQSAQSGQPDHHAQDTREPFGHKTDYNTRNYYEFIRCCSSME